MTITNNNPTPFKIKVLTLYPEAFPSYLQLGVIGKALKKQLWSLEVINIRDFAKDKHKKVDDKVFGGGKGLLIKPDVLSESIEFALKNSTSSKLIYPSAQGVVFNQNIAKELIEEKELVFICGHFEGIDERIINKYQPLQLSIGDYILSGGELSSIVIIDSVLRLLPNVLNSIECTVEESFNNSLLEYPQYTQPANWQGLKVPDVLLSGNHKKIKQWRLEQSIEKTKIARPDLFKKYLKSLVHKD